MDIARVRSQIVWIPVWRHNADGTDGPAAGMTKTQTPTLDEVHHARLTRERRGGRLSQLRMAERARNLPGSVGGQQEAEIPGAGSGRQHPAQVTDLSTGYGSSPLFPWLAHRGHKVCRSDLRCRAPRT